MSDQVINANLKGVIANNLLLLMEIYSKSRKEVCSDLDISYTTFCDWVNARTYPRMDAIEELSYYFRLDTRDFFIDIEKNARMLDRLTSYASRLGVALKEDRSTGILTVGDYNETPEGYPVELIRGNFWTMDSPSARHQRILAELSTEVSIYIRSKKGKCKVFPGPFDVELPVEVDSVVVPDITVICDSSILNEKRCVGTPDWIVEILSKSTKDKDQVLKQSVYAEAGVREYWIIDQYMNRVTVSTQPNKAQREFEETNFYNFSDDIPVGIYEDLVINFSKLDID